MKWLYLTGFLLTSMTAFSQATVQAGTNKQPIFFSYSIWSVDMGSRDVIGQIVKNADTILQIKASRKF